MPATRCATFLSTALAMAALTGTWPAYTYRVKAQFDAANGSGERLTGRVCEFRFTR